MDENEIFENHHFIFNKRLQMLTCIWPYQKKSLKLSGRITTVIVIHAVVIPLIIRGFEEWSKEDKALDVIIENFTAFLYFQGSLSKLYNSIFAEKKLQHLYELVTKDYKEIRDPEERAAMIKMWNIGWILSIILISYAVIGMLFFIFTPQILPVIFDVIWPLNDSRSKSSCFYAEYFIDQEKYLYYIVFGTFVSGTDSLLIACAVDTTFIAVAYHVIGLFNIIMYRLNRLSDLANEDISQKEKVLHTYVQDIIKIHIKTFLADLIRHTYDTSFFFAITVILMVFSFGTIEVMMNLTNVDIMIRIGPFWIGMIGYLFYINWPGQKFLNANNELLESIYSCNWYKLPVKTQLLLRMMMMRCLIPCQLTAGPLLQMNFASCGLILRTAYSYFTAVSSFA